MVDFHEGHTSSTAIGARTGMVNQQLLSQNEYLIAENRRLAQKLDKASKLPAMAVIVSKSDSIGPSILVVRPPRTDFAITRLFRVSESGPSLRQLLVTSRTGLDFQRQTRRNAARCHPIRVAGLTITNRTIGPAWKRQIGRQQWLALLSSPDPGIEPTAFARTDSQLPKMCGVARY